MIRGVVVLMCLGLFLLPMFGRGAAVARDVDVSLSFAGLEPLATEHYEGWLVVGGVPVSTGKFTVAAGGAIQDLAGNPKSTFRVPGVDLTVTTKFVLSIEPAGDTDAVPAAVKPLAGDLNPSKSAATLTANLGKAFTGVSGKYILATPTDGAGTNEWGGVWFLDPTGPTMAPGLALPNLAGTDWTYEGWVVIGGKPVTTGRFDRVDAADGNAPFSGSMTAPPFPGEDFLLNAPTGLTFPPSLNSSKVVVSIEPRVDADPGPFQFKPLVGDTPAAATIMTPYILGSSALATGAVAISPVPVAAQAAAADLTPWIVVLLVIVVAAVAVLMSRRRA